MQNWVISWVINTQRLRTTGVTYIIMHNLSAVKWKITENSNNSIDDILDRVFTYDKSILLLYFISHRES